MPGVATADLTLSDQLERRRQDVAALWDLRDELVLIGAGEPVPVPGRGDRTYRFRAHSEYFYLTDRERPGGVLAFDPDSGWSDFVVPVSRDERLWEGASPEGVTGASVAELEGWLERRGGRPVACLGVAPHAVAADADLTGRLRRDLNRVRRRKD